MPIKTLIVITLNEREVDVLKLILPKAFEMFNLDDEEPDLQGRCGPSTRP